jgi:hypothetical protein
MDFIARLYPYSDNGKNGDVSKAIQDERNLLRYVKVSKHTSTSPKDLQPMPFGRTDDELINHGPRPQTNRLPAPASFRRWDSIWKIRQSAAARVPPLFCRPSLPASPLMTRTKRQLSYGHGSPRKGMSQTVNTRDTRDRIIVSRINTRLIPEDV